MYDQITLLRDRIRTARAIVFDMDGVLVDSEKHHFLAHQKALAEFGVEIDKSFYIVHGVSKDPAMYYAEAFKQEKLPTELIEKILSRKSQIYKMLQEEEGIIPIEPAIALVNTLYERKIPLAIASTVHRDEVNNIMQHLRIDRCFTVIVAGDDFPLRNKPFPDIYFKVAELLGVHPIDCIAIEDSGNGATAAIKTGMTCVVVPNDYTRTHNFTEAIVLPTLSEIEKLIMNGEKNDQNFLKLNI